MNQDLNTFDTQNKCVRSGAIFAFIRDCVKQNKIKRIHHYKGKTWMRQSLPGFLKNFPHLSIKKIRMALDYLIKNELIIKGEFNKHVLDHTSWYTLVEEKVMNIEDKLDLPKKDKRDLPKIDLPKKPKAKKRADHKRKADVPKKEIPDLPRLPDLPKKRPLSNANLDSTTVFNYINLSKLKKNARACAHTHVESLECSQLKRTQRPASLRASASSSLYFSFEKKKFENLSTKDLEEWKELFPALDIDRELKLMIQWLLNNPAKSNKKLWRKFIFNWLWRSNDNSLKPGNNSGYACIYPTEIEENKKWAAHSFAELKRSYLPRGVNLIAGEKEVILKNERLSYNINYRDRAFREQVNNAVRKIL